MQKNDTPLLAFTVIMLVVGIAMHHLSPRDPLYEYIVYSSAGAILHRLGYHAGKVENGHSPAPTRTAKE